MASRKRFRNASLKAQDTAAGGSFGPGEQVTGVDPKDPYDKQKIDAGIFVEIRSPRRQAASRKETD